MIILIIVSSIFMLLTTIFYVREYKNFKILYNPLFVIICIVISIHYSYYFFPKKTTFLYRFYNSECIEGYCEDGFGKLETSLFTYEGEFENGLFNGQGTWISKRIEANKIWKKSGSWKNGQLHGEGIQINFKQYGYETPTKYVGNFSNGKKDGYGVERYYWGDRFEGTYECCSSNRVLQIGTMFYSNGTSKEGVWELVSVKAEKNGSN